MRYYPLATVSLLTTLLLAGPGLAKHPVTDIQSFNVNRLLSTNRCPGCDLTGVDLRGAHLIGADLRQANLTGADLEGVNLEGADLTKANLTGANLTGAFLTNASLVSADLDNANLTQAQLYFVDVTDASLDNLNLAEATIVGTPISVGSGTDPDEEEAPILNPEDVWQLHPPSEPTPWPSHLMDVPPEILPIL